MVKPLLRGEHRCYHCLIYLRFDFLNPVVLDFVTELVLQEGLHLMRLPHVVPDHVPAALRNFPCRTSILLCNAGIGQVHEFILGVGRIVVLRSEPQIRRLPDPDRKWIDTGDHDPLSDVELFAKYDKRAFDVLLDDPDGRALPTVLLNTVHHFIEHRMNLDATASRLRPWLNDP